MRLGLILANIRLSLPILGPVHKSIVVQIHGLQNIVDGFLQGLVRVNHSGLVLLRLLSLALGLTFGWLFGTFFD